MTDPIFKRPGEKPCPDCDDGECPVCRGRGWTRGDDAGTGHAGAYHRDTHDDCVECEGYGEHLACQGTGFVVDEDDDGEIEVIG